IMYQLEKAPAPFPSRVAFAVCACFLIAPHNMIYDHTLFVPLCALMVVDSRLRDDKMLMSATVLLLAWQALFALVPGLDSFPFSFFVVLFFAGALAFNGLRLKRPKALAEAG
ncbi:MAG: hypothetical protein AAFR27_10415, partial [Pseudomonadota bacterium]